MEEAHRRHAKMPWKDLVAPAAALAGEGLLVDWWTTLTITSFGRRSPALSRERGSIPEGRPAAEPAMGHQVRDVRLPQDTLKATLSHLAEAGPRDFYQGDLAKSIASDIKADGGSLSVEDLAAFRAHLREPLAIPYRGGKVYATPELTAGPTMAHALRLLQQESEAGGRAGCGRLCRICARLAGGLPRAAQGHGRCRRQALARRRISGAGLHHAFLRRRPPRQHRRGDADAALVVRLEIRDAAHRHRHEQRHHVVRPDARHHQLARTRQALPLPTTRLSSPRPRTASASRSAPPAAAASCRR